VAFTEILKCPCVVEMPETEIHEQINLNGDYGEGNDGQIWRMGFYEEVGRKGPDAQGKVLANPVELMDGSPDWLERPSPDAALAPYVMRVFGLDLTEGITIISSKLPLILLLLKS
jgi:hypothetical protein